MDPDIFTKETTAIVYGYQATAVQRMLDFDTVCGRKRPSVAAIVNPGRASTFAPFFETGQVLMPVYANLREAAENHPEAEVLVNFASHRSAYAVAKEAMALPHLSTIVMVAEGVPERQTRELIALAKKTGKMMIGPATVGGVSAGKFRIGNSGGTIANIIASRLHRPGSAGLVSKSGGLLNEMFNILSRHSDGAYEGIAIGGDTYPGSTFLDHLLRFERIPDIRFLVMLGELGAGDEAVVAEALRQGRITKPLVAWVSGTCADIFPTEVQFGHAGAKSGNPETSAQRKSQTLKEAGAVVPASFDGIGEEIGKVYQSLLKKGVIRKIAEPPAPVLPEEYAEAMAKGTVRRERQFISTISDDRGEEVTYGGKPLSELIAEGAGIGEVIGRLWFKKTLKKKETDFIELVLMAVADHGPAVSGAHNAIVAARAGKDIVSSLASGLLTIGPRFGGAIDEAAREFKAARDQGMSPEAFVEGMKAQQKYIPGIGHRVKSVQNPDKRVEMLKEYGKRHFTQTGYLDYALEVEKLTTAKKGNLILNVDGAIATLFLDMMESSGLFTRKEIQDYVEMGFLNGLFALGRSVGMIGHIIDQYRLKAPLYRVPADDILYVSGQR